MAVLPVTKLGNPVLRQKTRFIEADELASPEMQSFIDDMVETMREEDGVGLAAPQVDRSLNLLVMEVAANPRYPEFPALPLTILVNVEIIGASEELVEDWEGCLSIPDIRGLVDRHQWIEIRSLDRHGNPSQLKLQDFPARIFQHEHDHLIGKIFLERMKDFASLGYSGEIAAQFRSEEAVENA